MKKSLMRNNTNETFQGKVVIVTGSSKGIGKATAFEFLKAGAIVVLNGRNPEILRNTCNEFESLGFNPVAISGDMCNYEECKGLINNTVEAFGRIDILVNNAGGGFRGKIEDTTPDVFKKVVDSNLMSSVNCTLAALNQIKGSGGSIIFISSLSGLRGLPLNGPYCVAKMGLTALAQTLRLELHGSGVHIGLIMVGLTDYDEDKQVTSADGTLIPISRKSHQTREQVARKVLMTVRKRKFIVILTALGKLNSIFQRISPSMVEWVIRRSKKSKDFNK